jgi:hypothetical protein
VQHGETVDTVSTCPPLNAAEEARFEQMLAAARYALRGTSERAVREFVARQAPALAKRCAIAPEAAR